MKFPIKIQTALDQIQNRIKASKRLRIFLISAAAILFLENLLLAYNNLQAKTPILGLKIDSQIISLHTAPGVKNIVDKRFASLTPLKFLYNGQIIQVGAKDVGLNPNSDLLAAKILTLGRTGNIWQRVVYQNLALLGFKSQKFTADISERQLALFALELQTKIARDAQPPMPDFKNDPAKIIPAQDGKRLNTTKFLMLLRENFFNPPKNPVPLPVEKTFTAAHSDEEVRALSTQARELVKSPISISSSGQIFTLTTEDLKTLLTVVERPDPANPQNVVLNLRLSDTKLNQKLGEFATRVEAITHAEFDDHDARVAIYSQFYSGKRKILEIPTGRGLAYQKVLGENTGGEKFVYLTFDDGPNGIYHPLILDVLRAENVKATFFLVGNLTQKTPDVAQRTKAEGHVLGNHSLTHSFLPNLSQDAILKELQLTDNILNVVNGKPIAIFRPPYGGINAYVQRNSQQLGLKLILWDVDPKDWSEPSVDELIRRVITATHPGANILLHSNHLVTARALPKIIGTLKSQGYSFKTLE